jgi:pilus assembly protein CpaE
MPVITVVGAKGGCGASLVATNLAVALSHHGTTLLVDLHDDGGVDDLLLDLRPDHSWVDLLSVAEELNPRHLEIALAVHVGGLRFLAGPALPLATRPDARSRILVQALAREFEWTILDQTCLPTHGADPILGLSHLIVLVVTADPPALRAAQRFLGRLPAEVRDRARLVVNQFTRAHPAHPATVSVSLQCPMLAVFPTDPRAVGFQVNFGRSCLLDPQSGFGRGAAGLARTLAEKAGIGRRAA